MFRVSPSLRVHSHSHSHSHLTPHIQLLARCNTKVNSNSHSHSSFNRSYITLTNTSANNSFNSLLSSSPVSSFDSNPSRTFFGLSFTHDTETIKEGADSNKNNANIQSILLNRWYEEGKYNEIIERIQSNQYAHNSETQAIYLNTVKLLNNKNSPNINIGNNNHNNNNTMKNRIINSNINNNYSNSNNSNKNSPQSSYQSQSIPNYTQFPTSSSSSYNMQNPNNNNNLNNFNRSQTNKPTNRLISLFQTQFPSLFPSFSSSADSQQQLGSASNPVFVQQKPPPPSIWSILSYCLLFGTIGTMIVTIGYQVTKANGGAGSPLNPFGTTKQFREFVDDGKIPKVLFSHVKGCDEAKAELEDIVEFLKNPSKFQRLGGKMPKGVLLHGEPGTGKTLLARAVAGEAGVPFFATSGSEFEEMFVGLGAKRVRDLFAKARANTPCIVFIDEIDAIGGKRNGKEQSVTRLSLNQLLAELDGFEGSSGVIVIGATNLVKSLDPALVRPGRFDRQVTVPLPDVKGRLEILKLYAAKVLMDPKADLGAVARRTPGFSGADLFNLVNEAAIRASITNQTRVGQKELEHAQDKIAMGPERIIRYSEASRKCTAFHEAGHTLVSLLTPQAMPLYKVTIIPRSMALGVTSFLPDEEPGITKAQLLARIDVLMGGRIAESLIFGAENITAGASDDLRKATETARVMVTKLGMGKSAGLQAIDIRDGDTVSPALLDAMDNEVKEILELSYKRAEKILITHSSKLHRIANSLLEKETLEAEEVKQLIY